MRRGATLVGAALLLSACGGSSGPIYTFEPSDAPLLFRIATYGDLHISAPMGEQDSSDSTHALVAIEIGAETERGRQVSATFRSLDFWQSSAFENQHVGGGDLIGLPFKGTLSPQGVISINEAPDVPDDVLSLGDPARMLADLLPPLPPGGAVTETSWPDIRVVTSQDAMSLEHRYEGTARLSGDTIWNGINAQVIISEGTINTRTWGTPPDAAGEVEMTQSGTSTTTYIWDRQSGVMLAATTSIDADGEVNVSGMEVTMVVTYSGTREVRLQQ